MLIMGRITVNGADVQFAAKVEIRPEYWNVKAGKAIGRFIEAQEVNNVLDNVLSSSKYFQQLKTTC